MLAPLPISDLETFVSTRDAMHRVAEHVLAKARYLDDGEIRLTAFPGGFSTPPLTGGRRVRVDGADLVVDTDGRSARIGLTTIDDAAAFLDIEPGFPIKLYVPATECRADEPLALDRDAAEALAAWYGFTAEVLGLFATEIAYASPSQLILWPEHFDQAFYTEDADASRRANYGASPGDDGHPEPYMYVGPWGTPAADPFWNAATFKGAVLPLAQVVDEKDPTEVGLRFLRRGRKVLAPTLI
ncbi:MAG TPA: hypothetical protein VNB52_13055 [Ilumatobacteraceae bacterium]|nr:hypothetical protein [Ilumatobacteraceae bacterium]